MDFDNISHRYGRAVAIDIMRRKDGEKDKARQKYGDEALQPGGRPEFDVLDFSINEVVGLDRYGEMIQQRFANTAGTEYDLEILGQAMREFSEMVAPKLVAARHYLQAHGISLGVTEINRFTIPDQKVPETYHDLVVDNHSRINDPTPNED